MPLLFSLIWSIYSNKNSTGHFDTNFIFVLKTKKLLPLWPERHNALTQILHRRHTINHFACGLSEKIFLSLFISSSIGNFPFPICLLINISRYITTIGHLSVFSVCHCWFYLQLLFHYSCVTKKVFLLWLCELCSWLKSLIPLHDFSDMFFPV